jgi:hypothetical protein
MDCQVAHQWPPPQQQTKKAPTPAKMPASVSVKLKAHKKGTKNTAR